MPEERWNDMKVEIMLVIKNFSSQCPPQNMNMAMGMRATNTMNTNYNWNAAYNNPLRINPPTMASTLYRPPAGSNPGQGMYMQPTNQWPQTQQPIMHPGSQQGPPPGPPPGTQAGPQPAGQPGPQPGMQPVSQQGPLPVPQPGNQAGPYVQAEQAQGVIQQAPVASTTQGQQYLHLATTSSANSGNIPTTSGADQSYVGDLFSFEG